MKKIYMLTLLVVANIATYASPVDSMTARTVGFNFLSAKIEGNIIGSASSMQLAYKSVSNNGTTCFYVFNLTNIKGFVIVSADDAVEPILGYSTESNYRTSTPRRRMPAHVAGWMDNYTKQIDHVSKQKTTASPAVKSRWDELKSGTNLKKNNYQPFGTPVVPPLLKTFWDQSTEYIGPPYTYNALCPYDTNVGDRGVTGCVATTMAQVMKYWNYPPTGVGKHTYTPPFSCRYLGLQTANYRTTTYQWALMPDSLTTSSTPEQINAVATLMYQAGVSVDMDYSTGLMAGSGSNVTYIDDGTGPNAQSALVSNFGYDNSMRGVLKTNYTDTVWVGILKNEFNNNRPVVYEGAGNAGGHCWMADGYDNTDFIHFNWGWSGYDNGYYSVENLSPGGDTFNMQQAAIIGIQPKISYAAAKGDSLALVALYDSTGGSNWANNSGWLKGPVTKWYGIMLNTNGTVASINLSGNNLTGSIPYSLQNLSQLTTLDLSNNNLSGSLPGSIFSLDSLLLFDLSYNQFTGTIPDFPQGSLQQLVTFKIAGNQLSGAIPNSFSNLGSLQQLDLSGNQLTSLPSSYPTNIGILDFSNNKLTGTLQSNVNTLNNLQNLYTLVLSNNQLSGSLPELQGPEYLFYNNNQFTGSLPTTLPQYISVLDVSNNKLSGTLNKKIFSTYTWQSIFLSSNQFSGAFPSLNSPSTLGSFYILSAAGNKFSGALPTTLGDAQALTSADFSNNAFTGAIPKGITSLNYTIANLRFANNQLSGAVPNLFDSLQFLYRLDISGNKYNFTGMSNVSSLSSWITNDIYAPQAEVKLTNKGGKLSVTVGDQVANNTYNWYDVNGLVQTITGDSSFTPQGSGNYYMLATNINAPALTLYSDTINFAPLPITLLDFHAVPAGREVLVTWQTATELNTNHFNIQHSIDGVNFNDLGSVKAVGSGANSYQFADLSPVKGTDYYRLQSVDNDGTLSYSKVASVNFTASGSPFTLFPNPVKGITTLHGSHIASLQVIDNLGRIIDSKILNDATNPTISFGALQAGAYHLRIQTTDGKTNTVNFVKE